MNTIFKKLISGVLAVLMVFTCLPVAALAATTTTEDDNSVEMNDGYISVSVSKENGGFLVDTLLGNQLKASDDSKNLLFPSEGYDTSFTSFQVTRTDGSVEEYVFGRQYGFLGILSSGVNTVAQGSSIVSTWSVKDLTIVQTLSFVDETNSQHGQVDISYDVTTTANDVANVKARIMLDTALGSQDYGFYQLHSKNGGYNLIQEEAVIENAYDNVLMAVTYDGASPVTSYTVNAIVDGTEQKPYQVAFGHWANLANTVFSFAPDVTRPPFDIPYDGNYMTADSAYALYYDLGEVKKGETTGITTFYGVYSNVTVSEDERVAINFTQIPTSMKVKDGSTLENASYHSQVDGGKDGDIEVKMLVENLTPSAMANLTVLVKTMNNVYSYTGNYPADQHKTEGNLSKTIHYIAGGDTAAVSMYFNVTPLNFSEYRYFEVEVYSGTTISENNLLGSNGFYLLCPSVLGEEVSFNTTNPQTIYVEGSRSLYISGENFRLLKDTSDYVAYLRPVGDIKAGSRQSGQTSTVIPGTNIVVNEGENTMNVLVQNELAPGTYELVLDWVEDEKGETTSRMLLVHVSDDPAYKVPTYGILTVERTAEYTQDNPTYQVGVYKNEEEYKKTWNKIKQESNGSRNIYEEVLLEFRGDFSMAVDQETQEITYTATSVKQPDGSITGSINISNSIEVEGGYVTVRVENPGMSNQCIYTDIDGHVMTSGERTEVWDGVCAITPIANGDVNQLVQYYENGQVDDSIENTTALANTISLLWPAAAGTAQTICGIFFDLRYCEFGTIATSHCDKNMPIPDDVDRHRVVAFSAVIDPSFLLPTDFLMGDRELNNMELAQRTFAKKNYTSSQLVEVDQKYKADMKKWMKAQGGTLTLAVENILFGDNRFIGFDAELSVGIPSYFEGLGGVEGTLMLAVWKLDPNKIAEYKVGVDGTLDLEIVTFEATLIFKSIYGIPLVDELYLYVGGITPGWNVDGFGVLWVTGLGGGFANFHETVMSKSKVPAFSISLEGGFSLFQILFARLKLTLSARGFTALIKGVGFNKSYTSSSNMPGSGMHGNADILTIIPSLGVSLYWYPKFQASAHVEVNILTIIEGRGYIVLEENTETNKMFFEALASCTVQTPNIPLIGVIKLGGVDVGIDLERIYGALHVLKLDMGVCYYYGGDVDFSFGKYDVPAPTLLSVKVGELSTGEPVYMAFGTNITEVASTKTSVLQLSDIARLDNTTPAIISATDRMHHTFSLGDYNEGDRALTITYPAETIEEARIVAKGGLFSKGLELTSADGTRTYDLEWLDVTEDILDPEVADSANALLNYDAEKKEASVTISFTEKEDYDTAWQLTSSVATDLVLYSLTRLADIDSVGFNADTTTVTWTGSELDDFDKLTISALKEDGTMYPLYETEDTTEIQSGSVEIKVPETLPTGTYTIQISAKDEDGNVNDIEESETTWKYINPKQPGNPTVSDTRLGGDYRIDVDVQVGGNVEYTGYTTIVEEYDDVTGEWIESEFAQQDFAPDSTTLAVGGSFTSTNFVKKATAEGEEDQTISYSDYINMTDEEKETVTVVTETIGLQAGTKYRVKVNAYVITDSMEILYSEPQYSGEVTMVEPNPAEVTVKGINAKSMTEINSIGEEITRDVYTKDVVNLELTADQASIIKWKMDNGDLSGEATVAAGEVLPITLKCVNEVTGEETGISQGEHILHIRTINENGDEATSSYGFRVDAAAPKLQISSPQTGSFFGKTVTVTGISEPGAIVTVWLDGKEVAAVEVPKTVYEKDADGNVTVIEGGTFSVDVEMNTEVYEQTISVQAKDEVGNESRKYDLVVINELIGQLDTELAIYLNGQDMTEQVIPGGVEDGILELRYVKRDENGLPYISIAVPGSSNQAMQSYWETYIVAGSGSVSRENGKVLLNTSTDVNGMLTVTVDKQQVSAVLGGNTLAPKEYYTITLPVNPEGYTVTTEDPIKVNFNSSFDFTVTVNDGYNADNMKVFANNMELTGTDGVYTVNNITSDVTITVTGVADITAPEVGVEVEENKWTEFLNTITFGLFFKNTVDAKITSSDAGSGVYGEYYIVSTTPITSDALETASWQAYNGTVKLDPDGEYVVYAKVVDNAGNVRYASSDGLVLDATAPSISGIEDGGVYFGDVTFSATDKYIASIVVNGEEVTENVITLHPAEDIQTVVITDRAGNETALSVTVNKIPDTTAPTLKIQVQTNAWTELLNTITFGLFFDKTEEALITAADDDSGVKAVYYLISDEEIALTDLAAAQWIEYNKAVALDSDGNYIVYAKAEDNEGNISYASTDGLVIDTTIPGIIGIVDGGVYYDEVTFTVEDANIKFINVNGKLVDGPDVTLKPQVEDQTITVIDEAGNEINITVKVTSKFKVTAQSGEGYTVKTSAEEVLLGESYSFTVDVAEGYDSSDMIVSVNGEEVKGVDGVYTVTDVDATQVITVQGVADTAAPELSVSVDTITWKEILNNITFGLFFGESKEAVVTASDNGSGISGIYYLISDKAISSDELERAEWTEYTKPVALSADGNYVVYAKAADKAGNVSYANTDGLIIDTTVPGINGIVDGGIYYDEVTFTVEDANIKTITVNGEKVEGPDVTLKPSTQKQVIVVTDEVGNEVTVTVKVTSKFQISAESGDGYTVKASAEEVELGEGYTFTVEVAEGYDSGKMVVSVNGIEVKAADGIYTVTDVDAAQTITVTGVADITAPELSVTVDTKVWKEIINNITFGLFFAESKEATVSASDIGSGIASVEYLISDTELEAAELTKAQWTAYTAPVALAADGNYIVYAKAMDKAGNITYVNSDGLVIDTTIPGIEGIVDGGVYYDEVTFTVQDANIKTITVNGEKVDGPTVTLKPSVKDQVIVVTDEVGNEITVTVKVTSKFKITVPDEDGYTVKVSTEEVELGERYTFTVDVAEGYDATDLVVRVNGNKIEAVNGVYTVTDVDAEQVITVTGVADITAPELTVKVETHVWQEIINDITQGIFFKETKEAVLTASDSGSGLYGVYYLLSTNPIALDDLANAGWKEYTEPVKMDGDGKYVVYAKAVDNAGNVCYVNSTGLVIDTVAPSVTGIEDGGVYTGEVTFTVQDEYIDSVTINGALVEGDVFTLQPAEGVQTIVITDWAGNKTVVNVTVKEAPEPEKPGCNGKDDCPTNEFPDLDSGAWYHNYTDYVITNKLMQGFEDGTFRPNEKLSRAMLVQVLYNLEGRPAVTGKDHYTDTNDDSWYAEAILWGTNNGIINGYGNDLFGPNDPVTREQMATIFYRYSEMKGYSMTEGNYNHFTDKESVSRYAEAAMRWAVGNGLINGMGDGTLCPRSNTTRAEFAAVIQRFCETIAK